MPSQIFQELPMPSTPQKRQIICTSERAPFVRNGYRLTHSLNALHESRPQESSASIVGSAASRGYRTYSYRKFSRSSKTGRPNTSPRSLVSESKCKLNQQRIAWRVSSNCLVKPLNSLIEPLNSLIEPPNNQ